MNKLFGLTSALAGAALALAIANPVVAQVAEVPKANTKGDFTTARVMGNRGYYRNTHWLVVDPGQSLNCRATPNGAITARLMTGWIVKAVFPSQEGDAITMHQGSPWLQVMPPAEFLRSGQGACFVRANRQYIAPISADFSQVSQTP